MTEYEILSLAQVTRESIASHIMNFVGVYFAVVVAAYFVADKLPKVVVFGIIVMFSTFAILNVSEIWHLLQFDLRLQDNLAAVAPNSVHVSPISAPWGPRPISFLLMYLLGITTAVGFPLYIAFREGKSD